MKWINVDERTPNHTQNVIAIGTWNGEISGVGEEEYIGIGSWINGTVFIDSDTYSTSIIDVTHWMPLPEAPDELDRKDRRIEIINNLIAEQAEDEGLWFMAETAPEAYLQQELRRLHAALDALSEDN